MPFLYNMEAVQIYYIMMIYNEAFMYCLYQPITVFAVMVSQSPLEFILGVIYTLVDLFCFFKLFLWLVKSLHTHTHTNSNFST